MSGLLDGLRVLVLEDEFLIAMDVEQLCRDHGASDIAIARNMAEAATVDPASFDIAVVDLALEGRSTQDFAHDLKKRSVPFVFASGYVDLDEILASFPGIGIVTKPYAGEDLIQAIAKACGRL